MDQLRQFPTFKPIAIIGAACRLPGAPDLVAFADLLHGAQDAVTEIPAERWSRAGYLHPDPGQPGRAYTMAAGVIEDVDRFDAAFFGISPREAVQMDPQQRLLLELAYNAFEDSGHSLKRLAGSRTGVYVGGSSSDYMALRLGDLSVADAYFMTGSTLSTLSNRISYVFDLRGPSFTVDTACSSSLVALHLACSAMNRGEIDLAVVGGVNLLLSPQNFVGFSRASMLSPRGRCHAFAEGADGYVRAEGGGVVLLKPLDAAIEDGDPIRGVIEGTGVNSDGRTAGLSLPSRSAQAALLRDVYASSRVDPDDLVYVEAHGTGTAVGDPIEAGALGDVLGRHRRRPLPVGSVKTNIGHLEAASGMAGLFKALLVLQKGLIPASLHCAVPNPAIDFKALNLDLLPEARAIDSLAERPAVAVNSFGFGGTNAHVVLSAAPSEWPAATTVSHPAVQPAPPSARPMPLLISARSEAALASLAQSWHATLDGLSAQDAAPLLRAAARGREHHAERLVANGAGTADLRAALAAHASGQDHPGLVTGSALHSDAVAFVYSGNGSQWAGMGLDALANPDFRDGLDEVEQELTPLLGWSVIDRLRTVDEAAMRRADTAQPLLFALQHATTRALAAAGVRPQAHLGHSVGEVAAAAAAGALSLADAARVIAARSQAQERTVHKGGMAVLAMGPDEALALLDQVPGVEIAAVNGRHSITVAGPVPALQQLERLAAHRRIHATQLQLDYAFHSAAMDPIRAELLAGLQGIRPGRSREGFYSTVMGGAHDGSGLGAEYWWLNVRAPVRFADALSAAIGDGCRILLEIGPNPVLQSYLRDGLRQAELSGRVLASLSKRHAGGDPFPRLAAALHVAGHDISRGTAFDQPPHAAIRDAAAIQSLPAYPWQRERYWYEATEEATDTIAAQSEHPLLGIRRGEEAAVWFNTLDTTRLPWLADHAVDGAALLPATAMVEMALAAARLRFPTSVSLDVLDLEITRPLLLEAHIARETRFSVTGARGSFELASRTRLAGEAWTVHATGRIAAGSTAPMSMIDMDGPIIERIDPVTLYALTTRLGLQYGPAFQTVANVAVHRGGADATLVTEDSPPAGFLTDPARTDGALQGLVVLAASLTQAHDSALLPWRIGRVRLAHAQGAAVASARLRVNRVGPRSLSADVALLDADGHVVASFGDCWFTRAGAAETHDLTSHITHTVAIPRPRPGTIWAMTDPRRAHAGVSAGDQDEASLLADAFVATAAVPAIARLADPDRTLRVGELLANGDLHSEAAPLLSALLTWLERDGIATCEDGQWRLAEDEDLPPATEIWQSVLDGNPQAVAEAALMAAMAEALPLLFAAGREATPQGLAALSRHLQIGAPAARSATAELARTITKLAAAWPIGRPLRVLELGADDGATTAQITDALARSGRSVCYVAAVAPTADPQAVVVAAQRLPGGSVTVWDLATEPSGDISQGGFDLVVGAFALARSHAPADALARVQTLMAPGGTLLLAEPQPNRIWDLRFGLEPGWLAGDGASLSLRDQAKWLQTLQGHGYDEPEVSALPGAVWSSFLITATGHGVAAAAAKPTRAEAGLVIVSEADDALGPALFEAMLAFGRAPITATLSAAAHLLQSAPPRDGDLVFVPRDQPDETRMLDGVARLGAALGLSATALADTTGLRLWVVARTDPADDIAAAALAGICRVLANEAPNLQPRILRLDRAMSADAAASLAATEIAAPDGETEITLSALARTVPRLRSGAGTRPAAASPAARLVIGRPGLLDTLHWEPMSPSAPGPNELAIAVAASGLNFRDVMWSLGLLPDEALLDGLAGATLGLECAGTVTAIGPGVTGFSVGDRVSAIARASLSTHVTALAQAVVKLPDDVTFAAGATVPVAFLTVCYALGTLANLQPGERVLIHGGAGGVGLAAIQYARHRGAIIFASAGSPAKRAVLRRFGVDHVLDTRSLAFADEIMALTQGQGVDVVLNSLAGEPMERSVGILRPFGRFLELGKRDLYGNTPLGLRALRHNVSYFAIDADQLPVQRPDVARRVFDEIQALMAQGVLRPLPHRMFRFADATDAFRLMQSAGHIGKIVLEPAGLSVPGPAAGWQPNPTGTYLVTGGLAGFGLQTARWLVAQGARSVALLGRRGAATPGAADILAGFEAAGAKARAFACDIADAASLSRVLDMIRAEMGPLRGVVHAAMVLDDALLPKLTQARFADVLRPKLQGALALDRLTRNDRLDLFLLFSSVTVTLGNPGQANYVAANAGLQALATARRTAGLPALSVGWGPIADVGYLSREQAVSEALAQRMGGLHLTSDEALATLPTLLAGDQSHVDVARLRLGAMARHLSHLKTPFFAEIMSGQASAEQGQVDLGRLLAESTPEAARILVGEIIVEEVAAITRAPGRRIDLDRSLTDLGMDSLMAMELRLSLERRFGSTLPLLSLADGASIAALSARLVRQLQSASGPPAPDATAALLAKYEPGADAPELSLEEVSQND